MMVVGFEFTMETTSNKQQVTIDSFLNQVRAGRRPVRTWFLEIDPVHDVCMCMCVCVCVCVCVSAPEAINN